MPKTAVGLFADPGPRGEAIAEMEALGLPRNEIRALGEPLDFAVTGFASIARIEFEVDLVRELMRIGAAKPEAEAYAQGVRKGWTLVFATGPEDKVDAAAAIMNRHGAAQVEEVSGPEPHLPSMLRPEARPVREPSVQTGRTRHSGGATVFTW